MSKRQNMKVSIFSRLINCGRSAIVVNSLHRSIVRVDERLCSIFQKPFVEGRTKLAAEEVKLLENGKVLVRKDINEFELFKNWYETIEKNTSSIKATLALTSRCNFSCPYCFENGYLKRAASDMTVETAEAVVLWLRTFALVNKSRQIKVCFYGGEPTLRIDLIEYLTTRLAYVFEPLGVDVAFSIFTNGATFTKRLSKIMDVHHFTHLQITLDGLADIHNKRRIFKNGRGTFDVIFRNIHKVINKTRVVILVNFDKENWKGISKLLDLFVKEGLTRNIEFAFNPVFQTRYNKTHCGLFSLHKDDIYKVWKNLYILTVEKGLSCVPLRIFGKGPCSYRNLSHLFFDPAGGIYKCIGFLGVKGLRTGSVNDEFFATMEKIEKQVSLKLWDNRNCTRCVYLPLCLGGCRFDCYVKSGNITGISCHKDMIEKLEIPLIKYFAQERKNRSMEHLCYSSNPH